MVKRLLVKRRKEILSELTQEIPANGIITVGNDSSATIELKDEKIAPEQFVIVCEEGAMTLLCRTAGTRVNGETLPQGALHNLQFGDEISIDGYTLTPETAENGNGALAESTAHPAEIQEVAFNPPPAETPAAPTTQKTESSLSDVLENLRAEEKFYFLIKQADADESRVYVETEEMWLGWDESGACAFAVDPVEIATARAQIRKDWSGVVLYPVKKGDVWLNEETITEPRRLKNDDKIFLVAKESSRLNLDTVVKFHEPTALLILDSILPKELPPPVLLDEKSVLAGTGEPDESEFIHSGKIPSSTAKSARKGNIFGYFTVTEIIIMAVGTLITAAIIFLILELY